MRCNFHFSGQQPSWKRRRQVREKGIAISSAILFKILAGIRSLPVAVDSFKLRKSFSVDRLRIHKTSSCSYSQLPKKGQSMTSLGRRAFVEKVSATRFAFCLLSESHCNPSLRGSIFFAHKHCTQIHTYARPAAADNGKAAAAAYHRAERSPGPKQERDIFLTPQN